MKLCKKQTLVKQIIATKNEHGMLVRGNVRKVGDFVLQHSRIDVYVQN